MNKFLVKNGQEIIEVTEDQIREAFVIEGLSESDIARKYSVPKDQIMVFVKENHLRAHRRALITEGLKKIQNVQIKQANELMKLESNFKKLKLIQLQHSLKDFAAYFEKYGDFYKRHHITGEVLKDLNGIPLQLDIPNVSKEISHLKESVSMSEGLKKLISRIDEIINNKDPKGPRNLNSAVDDFFGD